MSWVVVCHRRDGTIKVHGPYTGPEMDGPISDPVHPLHRCSSGSLCEANHADYPLTRASS